MASCAGSGTAPDTQVPIETGSGSSVSSTGSVVAIPTRNVSYVGTLEELGATIYQEGTHKLTLPDGQFILLQSTDQNLALTTYLGKRVEVRGSVQPTVEGNAEIMHVEEVTVLEVVASSEAASSVSSQKQGMCGGIAGIPCEAGFTCVDNPSDDCDPKAGGADCGGICVHSSSASSAKISSSASKALSSSTASAVASDSSTSSGPLEAQIALMAKQKYDTEALWTQKYCSSHTTFCVPAHKNWYFKSFGATTSNLWHVEFGMTSIEELHTGAVVLNLVAGNSMSMNAKDGQIKSEGNDVVGFKDWSDNRHFEIIGDARLKDAIAYMLSHITSYTAE